jgi:hypothetical protein
MDNEKEEYNKGFGIGSTTNPRCVNGHTWTYAGMRTNPSLEGMFCDCGKVRFHMENCSCCGQPVSKHIENK